MCRMKRQQHTRHLRASSWPPMWNWAERIAGSSGSSKESSLYFESRSEEVKSTCSKLKITPCKRQIISTCIKTGCLAMLHTYTPHQIIQHRPVIPSISTDTKYRLSANLFWWIFHSVIHTCSYPLVTSTQLTQCSSNSSSRLVSSRPRQQQIASTSSPTAVPLTATVLVKDDTLSSDKTSMLMPTTVAETHGI